MTIPFPTSAGPWRYVDGKLVRDDAPDAAADPTPPAPPASPETATHFRGRKAADTTED